MGPGYSLCMLLGGAADRSCDCHMIIDCLCFHYCKTAQHFACITFTVVWPDYLKCLAVYLVMWHEPTPLCPSFSGFWGLLCVGLFYKSCLVVEICDDTCFCEEFLTEEIVQVVSCHGNSGYTGIHEPAPKAVYYPPTSSQLENRGLMLVYQFMGEWSSSVSPSSSVVLCSYDSGWSQSWHCFMPRASSGKWEGCHHCHYCTLMVTSHYVFWCWYLTPAFLPSPLHLSSSLHLSPSLLHLSPSLLHLSPSSL